MIAELGIITTGLAFLAAGYALIAALAGVYLRQNRLVLSARNAALMTFPLLSVACTVMVYVLLNHEYSIAYVWQTTDNGTPAFYRYTALWGSQAGSLLFWSWLLSAFGAAALVLNWQSERRLMPYVIVVLMATLGFFLILNVFIENPFERYWLSPGDSAPEKALFQPSGDAQLFEPIDGAGLNPLLRHLGMVFHPPMLYLGFVGFTIPFAFAFAALATGRLGADWIRATRNWALIAWLFLSLGLLLGGRWAYDVLGWGGYWGWDPVENAALLPWLTGTAFLHSAVVQEKRGMLKFWNLLLIVLTFVLVVLGTFATRSGVVSSVHSFAESEIGLPMFTFMGVSTLASVLLLVWRQERGDLRGADELDSLFSKESLFLLNNWMFLGLTVVVLWGTWAEAITTIAVDLGLRDTVINLGPDYFPPVVRPFLIALYILMGIAPLAAWRRSTAERLGRAVVIPLALALILVAVLGATGTGSLWALVGYGLVAFAGLATITEIWKGMSARHRRGEHWGAAFSHLVARDRRRYGGYFIHLGIVVLGLGVIGSTSFQQITQQTLNVGERLELGPYTMRYDGLYGAQAEDGRQMMIAKATVYRGDNEVAQIRPRRDTFFTTNPTTGQLEPSTNMSIPGAHSTLANDFYAIITFWEGNRVTFRVYLNPLINFVWLGGFILIAGTLVALWPSRRSPVAARVSVPTGPPGTPGARGAQAGD
ncbi:MAG: heme lyase CcmF/NrfE family subunit [Anaerolineae bacterium]|nr:heme lyase CcmF/NrfE family subunit [Anaerolineae bacterium]